MKCPKCNYISFDSNEVCPNCGMDLSEVKRRIIIFPTREGSVNWLKEEKELELESVDLSSLRIEEQKKEVEIEPISLESLEIEEEDSER